MFRFIYNDRNMSLKLHLLEKKLVEMYLNHNSRHVFYFFKVENSMYVCIFCRVILYPCFYNHFFLPP